MLHCLPEATRWSTSQLPLTLQSLGIHTKYALKGVKFRVPWLQGHLTVSAQCLIKTETESEDMAIDALVGEVLTTKWQWICRVDSIKTPSEIKYLALHKHQWTLAPRRSFLSAYHNRNLFVSMGRDTSSLSPVAAVRCLSKFASIALTTSATDHIDRGEMSGCCSKGLMINRA